MDSDIKYIIEEEGRLVREIEYAVKAARERVEQHRIRSEQLRESGLNSIAGEFTGMTEIRLREIRNRMENELKGMREKQENLLNDADLRNKITGRIVSLILENRT